MEAVVGRAGFVAQRHLEEVLTFGEFLRSKGCGYLHSMSICFSSPVIPCGGRWMLRSTYFSFHAEELWLEKSFDWHRQNFLRN